MMDFLSKKFVVFVMTGRWCLLNPVETILKNLEKKRKELKYVLRSTYRFFVVHSYIHIHCIKCSLLLPYLLIVSKADAILGYPPAILITREKVDVILNWVQYTRLILVF